MNLRSPRLTAIIAGSAWMLCAGAGIAQSDVEQRAAQVKVYAFGETNTRAYEIVGRPWVDSWRSAFWVPSFPTRELAVAALQTEAARRGADGLLNVNCRDQAPWKWSSNTEPAFICYGIAIRFRTAQG
jgi:hypothetical protein